MRIIIENGSTTVHELPALTSARPTAPPAALESSASKAGATDAGGAPVVAVAGQLATLPAAPGAPTMQVAGAQSAGPAPKIG